MATGLYQNVQKCQMDFKSGSGGKEAPREKGSTLTLKSVHSELSRRRE
jgi:hypothetical protein